MTGGRVVVLGRTGRNFAAGMSGGIAYVFDAAGDFGQRCNQELVDLENVDATDEEELRALITRHARETGSAIAARILAEWTQAVRMFVRAMPRDYRAVMRAPGLAERQNHPVLKVANG